MKKIATLLVVTFLFAGCVAHSPARESLTPQVGKATFEDLVSTYGPPNAQQEAKGMLVCRWDDIHDKRTVVSIGSPDGGYRPTPLIASFSLGDQVLRGFQLP